MEYSFYYYYYGPFVLIYRFNFVNKRHLYGRISDSFVNFSNYAHEYDFFSFLSFLDRLMRFHRLKCQCGKDYLVNQTKSFGEGKSFTHSWPWIVSLLINKCYFNNFYSLFAIQSEILILIASRLDSVKSFKMGEKCKIKYYFRISLKLYRIYAFQ